MKYKTKIILVVFNISIISCFNEPCCENITIDIPVNVKEEYDSAPENYCCILKSALKGNKEDVKRISLLDFSDGFTYEHGNVLLEIINVLDEKVYISSLVGISKQDRMKILSYLNAGFNFSRNKKYVNKRIEDVYPELYFFLRK